MPKRSEYEVIPGKNDPNYKVIPENDYPNNEVGAEQSKQSETASTTFNFFTFLSNKLMNVNKSPVKEETETNQILKK